MNFSVELSEKEIAFLSQGLIQWGGPVAPSDGLARVIGFDSAADLYDRASSLAQRIRGRQAMSANDWWRSLRAAEINFASDTLGAGFEWGDVTSLGDQESFEAMRSVQMKVAREVGYQDQHI